MQGLVWRLKALDPQASESLKVITYFDALVNSRANAEMLIRGAAVLCDCSVGFAMDGRSMCVDASGQRMPEQQGEWPSKEFGADGRAWIERASPGFVNDELILERLAIALGIFWDRTSPVAATRRAIEMIISSESSMERRMEAAALLHLDRTGSYRVHAVPAVMPMPGSSAVVHTAVGAIRAFIRPSMATALQDTRAGVGLATLPQELDRSWQTALLALRITSPHRPIHNADDLGSLIVLAERASEATHEPADVTALNRLIAEQPKAWRILEAIAESGSLRAVASQLNLHHSSIQNRASEFTSALGFDIRTPSGRVRLTLALTLFLLATNRFD